MRLDTLSVLADIREAIGFIAEDTADVTVEQFLVNRATRQLVMHNLVFIGEALNRLRRKDPGVASRISQLDQIVAMRNILIHGYDVIDYPRVWSTIQVSIPPLLQEVLALIAEGDPEAALPDKL